MTNRHPITTDAIAAGMLCAGVTPAWPLPPEWERVLTRLEETRALRGRSVRFLDGDGTVHRGVLLSVTNTTAYVRGAEHGDHGYWCVPAPCVEPDTDHQAPAVHWPGQMKIEDGHRTYTVSIGVDGLATCHCGTSPIDAEPACWHIHRARALQADPARVCLDDLHAMWLTDEAWRPDTDRRANWAIKAKRRVDDARRDLETHDRVRAHRNDGRTIDEQIAAAFHHMNGSTE